MGYEVYITRADRWPSDDRHWSEDDGEGITFREWERLVEDDPELEIDYSDRLSLDEMGRLVDGEPELAGCRTDGGFTFSRDHTRRLKELARQLKTGAMPDIGALGYDTAEWTAHPLGEERCFWYEDRRISTKNPDVATLDKMLQLALRLDACVRGDDGELYRRSEQGLECYEPERGWLPLEEFHRGRPLWAPAISREIIRQKASSP